MQAVIIYQSFHIPLEYTWYSLVLCTTTSGQEIYKEDKAHCLLHYQQLNNLTCTTYDGIKLMIYTTLCTMLLYTITNFDMGYINIQWDGRAHKLNSVAFVTITLRGVIITQLILACSLLVRSILSL